MCVSCDCCGLSCRSLQRDHNLSGGVLENVVLPKDLRPRGLSSRKKKQNVQVCCTTFCSPGYIDSFRTGTKTLVQNKRAIIRGIQ